MSPFLSVVVPTMRAGGLNYLCDSLDRQTFRDFELVLSDQLWRYRHERVAKLAEFYAFPIVHVEPAPNPFPVSSWCKVSNAALEHARGEVVVFLVDYTYVPPTVLERHARFHREHGPVEGLMCPHQYLSLPSVPFPPYAKEEIDRYVADLEHGRLDAVMWGWGEAGTHELALDPVYQNADPKLARPAGPIDPSYFHAKNESVKLEPLLAVNGWDEEFDGTHPYQDMDLAGRLYVRAGVTWELDPANVVYIINPRPVFPFPRRLEHPDRNEGLWKRKTAAGYPLPNRGWSLRDRREANFAAMP
jgi:glycosyltransferase involved in cell wall biosynthesis